MKYGPEVASVYDQHFRRDVDRWEDERLARYLEPHMEGSVLDLGCGTGWVMDHFRPHLYVGIDESPAMLAHFKVKHPKAKLIQRRVGMKGWMRDLGKFDVVVATWAAHEFGPIISLLEAMHRLAPTVILHGQGPRYDRRDHYVLDGQDRDRAFRNFTPGRLSLPAKGWTLVELFGTGAAPDWSPRLLWKLGTLLPVARHYGIGAHWEHA